MNLNSYINEVVSKRLNLQKNQVVEIVTSSYIKEFNECLKHTCLSYGASMVFFRYRDGAILESKINDGYSRYIEEEIANYNIYIRNNSLVRITVESPYTPPVSAGDDRILEYKSSLRRLNFVNDYFNELYSQRTIIAASNPYWAAKLCMSEVDLWSIVYDMCSSQDNKDILSKLNKICPNSLCFIGEGTDLRVDLTDDYVFQGDTQYTSNNICFNPNYPCLEMFTAPLKYGVNGYITISRGFEYNGIKLEGRIEFENGKIKNTNLVDSLSIIDEGLLYTGEISLCEAKDNPKMGSLLLDENMGCHIALGYAYRYGIKEVEKINTAKRHIDLVFGTDKLDVYGIKNSLKIQIMKNGKFVL